MIWVFVLLLIGFCRAGQISGIGYPSAVPPMLGVQTPHLKTPRDTRIIAPKGPREAQLVCVEQAPVRRVVVCDIITWDVCGNLDGMNGNQTDWRVGVQEIATSRYSRLVSPVAYLQRGVARFYFTPVTVGVHRVQVWRDPKSKMLPLNTPPVMRQLVIVHDSLAKCTPVPGSGLLNQLRTVLWAAASFRNEMTAPAFNQKRVGYPTEVISDTSRQYASPSVAQFQQSTRRPSLNPTTPVGLGTLDSGEDFNYCDLVRMSVKT
jgi:hypothetical protein